ncbi:TPA: DUF1642 domain-containing protein [Enterococcus faecium]|nr:DUF1642 domain-containing protein [Enterococcus faecium]
MEELITKVEQWAKDKGLDQADSSKQMLKTIEEIGEVAASLARKDEYGLRDGIGDVVVTLIILAMQNDMDLYECLNQAYNEIKGRTGKMVDGVFVKSSDLKQLDEPKKLIVKPIVAGWIEKSTDFFTKAEKIAYLIKSKDGDSYYFCDLFVRDGILTQEQGEELLAWATRQSYETLLSLYNGYEVEKEPVWAIKNADGNYLTKCALWGKDGVNYSFECNPSYRLLFTDKATADAAALLVNGTVEEVVER